MALLGFAVFGYATGVPMAPWAPVLGERLAELTCFQLAFTAERALALLEADPGVAPLLAGLAAVLKYLLLSVPVPAYGIAGSIRGMRADRRHIHLRSGSRACGGLRRPAAAADPGLLLTRPLLL